VNWIPPQVGYKSHAPGGMRDVSNRLLTCDDTEPTPGLEPGTTCLQGGSGLSSGVHDVLVVLSVVHSGQPNPSDSGAFVTTV